MARKNREEKGAGGFQKIKKGGGRHGDGEVGVKCGGSKTRSTCDPRLTPAEAADLERSQRVYVGPFFGDDSKQEPKHGGLKALVSTAGVEPDYTPKKKWGIIN